MSHIEPKPRTASSREVRVLATGFAFPESPRWHDGLLWLSDIFGRKVVTVDLHGRSEVVRAFDDRPSGIGFLPDGSPIVVLMTEKQIVRIDTGEIHADLREFDGEYLNDMVVDEQGRAYVDYSARPLAEHQVDGENGDAIILVEPNGDYRIAATGGLHMPNGLVLTPDSRTLIAAMPPLRQLMSFSVAADGTLGNPRLFADLAPEGVDGMCLDAAGAIWVASPRTSHFLRVLAGGEVTDVITVEGRWAVACMLGGPDRRWLFMMTTRVPDNPVTGMKGNMHLARGSVEVVEVDIPGAGWP
jgi:sugar lactone lactonase YvrE